MADDGFYSKWNNIRLVHVHTCLILCVIAGALLVVISFKMIGQPDHIILLNFSHNKKNSFNIIKDCIWTNLWSFPTTYANQGSLEPPKF